MSGLRGPFGVESGLHHHPELFALLGERDSPQPGEPSRKGSGLIYLWVHSGQQSQRQCAFVQCLLVSAPKAPYAA